MQAFQERTQQSIVHATIDAGSLRLTLAGFFVWAKGDAERPSQMNTKWCNHATIDPSSVRMMSVKRCAQAKINVAVHD